jgi:uncharacterized protein YbaP (TraB family)
MSQPTTSHRRAKTLCRLPTAAFAAMFLIIGLLAGGLELRAQEKNFLWKIESGNGTVYILGSIHLLKKDSPPLSTLIDAAFDEAKRLVFEIDIVNEGPEKMQQLILQMGVNLDGKTLEQKVSKETYERAARWAKDLGIDIKMMSPLKPWVAGLTMLVMQLQKLGYDPNLGVDRQLAQRAKHSNKPVAGLETSAFQIGLFDGLPPRLQELMLRQSLAEMEQLGKIVDDMVRAWRSGDVAAAEKFFLESMKAFPELREKLIDERNRNWLPQIENLLTLGEPSLVVVGAAHLVGKNGVIELLKGRGYKLEQL